MNHADIEGPANLRSLVGRGTPLAAIGPYSFSFRKDDSILWTRLFRTEDRLLAEGLFVPPAILYDVATVLCSLGRAILRTTSQAQAWGAVLDQIRHWWSDVLTTAEVLPECVSFLEGAAPGSNSGALAVSAIAEVMSSSLRSEAEGLALGLLEKYLVSSEGRKENPRLLQHLSTDEELLLGPWLRGLLRELVRELDLDNDNDWKRVDCLRLRQALRQRDLSSLDHPSFADGDAAFHRALTETVSRTRPRTGTAQSPLDRLRLWGEVNLRQIQLVVAEEQRRTVALDGLAGRAVSSAAVPQALSLEVTPERRRQFVVPQFVSGRRERYSPELQPPVVEKGLQFLHRTLLEELAQVTSVDQFLSESDLAALAAQSGLQRNDVIQQINRWRRWNFARRRFRWGMPPQYELPVRHEYTFVFVLDPLTPQATDTRELAFLALHLGQLASLSVKPYRCRIDLLDVVAALPGNNRGETSFDWIQVPDESNVDHVWDTVHVLLYRLDGASRCRHTQAFRSPLALEQIPGDFPCDGGLSETLERAGIRELAVSMASYFRVLLPGSSNEWEAVETLRSSRAALASPWVEPFLFEPGIIDETTALGGTASYFRQVFLNQGDQDFLCFYFLLSPHTSPLNRLAEFLFEEKRLEQPFPFLPPRRLGPWLSSISERFRNLLLASVTKNKDENHPWNFTVVAPDQAAAFSSERISANGLKNCFLEACHKALDIAVREA